MNRVFLLGPHKSYGSCRVPWGECQKQINFWGVIQPPDTQQDYHQVRCGGGGGEWAMWESLPKHSK